jgi:hypothetical protein
MTLPLLSDSGWGTSNRVEGADRGILVRMIPPKREGFSQTQWYFCLQNETTSSGQRSQPTECLLTCIPRSHALKFSLTCSPAGFRFRLPPTPSSKVGASPTSSPHYYVQLNLIRSRLNSHPLFTQTSLQSTELLQRVPCTSYPNDQTVPLRILSDRSASAQI